MDWSFIQIEVSHAFWLKCWCEISWNFVKLKDMCVKHKKFKRDTKVKFSNATCQSHYGKDTAGQLLIIAYKVLSHIITRWRDAHNWHRWLANHGMNQSINDQSKIIHTSYYHESINQSIEWMNHSFIHGVSYLIGEADITLRLQENKQSIGRLLTRPISFQYVVTHKIK